MGVAILKWKTEGGSDAKKVVEDLTKAYVEAQERMAKAARETAEAIQKASRETADKVVRTAQEEADAKARIERESGKRSGKAAKDSAQKVIVAAMEITRAVVRETSDQGDAYRGAAVVAERAEKLVTRAKLRELALQGAAQKTFIERYQAALKLATAALEAEVGKRGQLSERERRQVEDVALAMVAAHEQSERTRTQTTQREFEKRQRIIGQHVREAGQQLGALAGAGMQFGSQAHDLVQDATQRRALVQSNVIEAVSQVGVTDLAEVNRYTDMAINAGRRHGLRSQDMTAAIGAAQTEFSSLEGMGAAQSAEGRAAIFQRAIDTAVRGRNMGVDPGEFSRLMGMLGQRGLDQGTQEFLSAWVVGAAQRGAVEPGSITREAMAPIIQRMSSASSALGTGATPQQRQLAARNAFMQAFSEVQVMRSMGEGVRTAAGNMANFERVLTNPGVHTRMIGNISHIADRNVRSRVQSSLFDRQGHMLAGLDNPVRFVAAVMGAGMTDPREMANLFAGTGAGNPMSLTAPLRRMALALASRDVSGQTGVDRINALNTASTALSPERLAAMAALREGSDQANLVRNEEERLAALSTNTGAINNLSTQFAQFVARNPLATAAATTLGPALGGAAAWLTGLVLGVGSTVGGAIVGGSALATVGHNVDVKGRNLAGEELTTGDRVARLGVEALGPVGQIGLGVYDLVHGARSERGLDALLDALPDRLAASLRASPLQVQVPPNAAVHEGTAATSARQGGGS